jgi:hypothetical protein
METALDFSSAAATVEGPLTGDTGHGLLHISDSCIFAAVGDADGRASDHFAIRILTEALRIAFRPKDGSQPTASVEGKARLIRNAIRAAGEAIASQPAEKRGGGATVAVLAIDENDRSRACILNVGDCCCYRLRNGRAERLTRNLSAADTAEDTPLLKGVLASTVGSDDEIDVAEHYVHIEPGDAFALLPGALFREKPEQAVARSLRRASDDDAPAMAAALVAEAVKAGNAAAIALVVCAKEGTAAAVADSGKFEGKPESIGAGMTGSDDESSQPVPMEPSESGDEFPAPLPSSEPQPDDLVVEYPGEEDAETSLEEKVEKLAKKSTRKIIVDDGAVPPAAMPAKPLAKFAKSAQPSAGPAKPSAPKPTSPLTRSPLIPSGEEPKKASALPVIAAAAAFVILVGGIVWATVYFLHHRSRHVAAETELQKGANAAEMLDTARTTGDWSQLAKSLSDLPPLSQEDDSMARAWIAFWQNASASSAASDTFEAHLKLLDSLIVQSGQMPPPSPDLKTGNRADTYCRAVSEKQKALADGIGLALVAMNKRSDIPFADRATQETVLIGLGQFTRGRLAQKIDTIRGDFATARISEGQLESWINLRECDHPQDENGLQRKPGEPLRQLGTSLDRAWDGLLEIASSSAADSAVWRKQHAAVALLPRLNRLDAVRANLIADRKRYGDIHRWRVSSANKQLAIWLLNETASLGAQLGKTNPPPAASNRHR